MDLPSLVVFESNRATKGLAQNLVVFETLEKITLDLVYIMLEVLLI
jgi:hypothetical protein